MPKPRAALYCRVSTLNQKTGDSLPAQESRLKAFCQGQGFHVAEVYTDAGISAKDTNRPQLQALLNDCDARLFDVVIVTDLSRISRSVADIDGLVKTFASCDVRFISLRENLDFSTVFGRGIANLLTSLNQIEREQAGERTSIVKAKRAQAGKFNGGTVPYGYQSRGGLARQLMRLGKSESEATHEAMQRCPEKGILYVNEEEAAIVQRIYKTFLQTNSLARCRDELNNAGIRTRYGKIWGRVSIHRILENPTYLGKVVRNKRVLGADGKWDRVPKTDWEILDGLHDAIVSEEDFQSAQNMLASHVKPRRSGRIYLFSGLLRCGYCGSAMTGVSRAKEGKRAYYKCSRHLQYGADGCQGLTWRADDLEEAVVDHLKGLAQDGQFFSQTEQTFRDVRDLLDTSDIEPEVKRLSKEIQRHRQRIDTLLDALQDNLVQRDDFQQRYNLLKDELSTLEAQRERVQRQFAQQEANFQKMRESFHGILNLWKDWEDLSQEGKQQRLQAIVETVTVTSDHIDIQLIIEGKVLSHMCSQLEHKVTYLSEPVRNLLQGRYAVSINLSEQSEPEEKTAC